MSQSRKKAGKRAGNRERRRIPVRNPEKVHKAKIFHTDIRKIKKTAQQNGHKKQKGRWKPGATARERIMRGNDVYERIIRAQIMDGAETTLSGILDRDGIRYEDLAINKRRLIVYQDGDDVKFIASGYIHLADPIYIAVEIDGSVDGYGVHIRQIKDCYYKLTVYGVDEDGKRWTAKEYLMERFSDDY